MRLCSWRASVVLAAVATLVAPVVQGQTSHPTDNAELARISQEDQDDRKPGLQGEQPMAGDREAIEAVAASWQDGWNRHDAAALASLLAEDVDFVTVLGPQGWLKGRKEFQPYHAEIHKVLFKDSVWRVKQTSVRFVRPDVAVAHVLWETKGDNVPDRPPGQPRNGLFIWVLEKRAGKWLVIAAQNTESRDLTPDQLPRVPK